MKIVHLSNTDSGGAIELHAAMLEHGVSSKMLVKGYDVGGVPEIYKISNFMRYRSNLGSYVSKLFLPKNNPDLSMFSIPLIGGNIHKHPFLKEAEVIYLHFVAQSSFISLFELESLLKLNKPVVFVTRDMWPMTGGCHYFLDCNSFRSSCNNCPHYESKGGVINWSNWQLQKKEAIFKKYSNLIFVGISDWCKAELSNSFATNSRKSFAIGNAIDTNLFQVKSKKKCKERLSLPLNMPVIGFGARSVNSPIKGYNYLKQAIGILNDKGINISIATFGSNNTEKLSSNHYHLGYINSREEMVDYYNALDIYISPTLAEAFGNTVAEAMACGTPVVGFNTGGLKDIIDHKENGYLANYKDANDLATGILFLLEKIKKSESLSISCRDKIITHFSRKAVVEKHMNLINTEFGI